MSCMLGRPYFNRLPDEMDDNDPCQFMIELCEVPPKQEDLLRGCPFVGDKANSRRDKPSPTSGGMQVASADIVMASLPETLGNGKDNRSIQDVFHAPPGKSSLHTSDDQPISPAVYHCTVNQMAECDEQTMGFVNFGGYEEGTSIINVGTESELGSSEVVAECSRRIDGTAVSHTYNCELNKVPILERELSLKEGLDELPPKMNSSEQNVAVSKELSMGVVNEGNDSAEKNLGSGENLGTQVVQPDMARSGGNFTFHDPDVEKCVLNGESSEVPRTAEVNENDEQPGERVLPSIFDVLNVIGGDSEEDRFENVSLVKIAKSRGMTFPSPRWRRKSSGPSGSGCK
ncbi:hypothetical protein L6164_028010 [Bauhinia variegata]|uniref:Uncharacterized protein n=1 Tax=Bauhinia variegata TaxID=167791 RepID=A0ACB9LWB1_BAUVA|nr:hypothetical protein L6164_028010 [Bauhinia variegata]